MAVDVRIKSNAKSVQKSLNRFFNKFPSITRKGLARASFRLQSIIKELTQQQKDFKRRKFAPYSESYLKRLEPQKVDLFYTGRMLGSITGKVKSNRKATIFFNNAEMRQRALFNQVLNEPKREFFGFDKRTEKIIQREFVMFMEKEIRKFRL